MRELDRKEVKMVASAWPRFQSWHSIPADDESLKFPGRPVTPKAYADLYEMIAH